MSFYEKTPVVSVRKGLNTCENSELKEKNQWVTFQCGDVGRRVRLTAHSERVLSLAALHVLTGHRSRTVPLNKAFSNYRKRLGNNFYFLGLIFI